MSERINNRELARAHLLVTCPYPDCCAFPGEPCRTERGVMRRPHAERMDMLSPEHRDAVFCAIEHVKP